MKRPQRRTKQAFTLMELMIVVAILGILAAIAIPTFIMLVNRSKTAEVSSNLNVMFKSAASYYSAERSGSALIGSVTGYCTVGDEDPSPEVPGKSKQKFTAGDNMRALGFTIADYVYFSYGLFAGDHSGNSTCGHLPRTLELYTFYANGDLDDDGNESTFELATGSDENNSLYHAHGMYVVDELE